MAETRFCPVCGTEVDETAAFCPTCGHRLDTADTHPDDIPAAPAWPQPPVEAEPPTDVEPEQAWQPEATNEPVSAEEPQAEQTLTWDASPTTPPPPPPPPAQPPPPPPAQPPAPAAEQPNRSGGSLDQVELPFTWPVTLSGWLIGIGSLVGGLSLLFDFRTFVNPVALITFVLLLGVAATVFLSTYIPDLSNRRLWVLVVVVAAFGVGLWRIGFGAGFAAAVFFLATLAAAAGAVMLELGRDRPMGGPVG